MRFVLVSFALLVLYASSVQGQSPWCPDGECAANCPFTRYALRYDWVWCVCPTRSECMQDPNQTCNKCYTSSLTWCDDGFNPWCSTYYLSGYDQFCGCQSGLAKSFGAESGLDRGDAR